MEDIRQYTFPSLSGPSGSATPSGKMELTVALVARYNADVQTYTSISLSLSLSSAEQLVAVDSLISSMDLMSADR